MRVMQNLTMKRFVGLSTNSRKSQVSKKKLFGGKKHSCHQIPGGYDA
jgi:hypothetical protein